MTCPEVEDQLLDYLKGGLSASRRQAIQQHLASCGTCAASVHQAEVLEAELYAEAARHRPTLARDAYERIQERIYRDIRRGLIVQRTTRFAGKVVGMAALLALLIAILSVWLWVPQEDYGTAGPEVTHVISTPDGGPAPTVDTAPPATGHERVVLRFAVYDWDQGRYWDLIEAFEGDNPDIQVKVVSIDQILGFGEGYPRNWPVNAWSRLASAADVIQLQSWDPDVVPGLVQNLMPFIEADATLNVDDFHPGTLAQCQDGDGIWCLPGATGMNLIFFDKDAFDQAGVPYPEPGWTWDDFLEKAIALTEREGDQVTRWGFAPYSTDHQPFIEGLVRPLIDTTTDPPTPRFDQPEVVEAVQWYADLYQKHRVTPFFELEDSSKRMALVEEGRVAMWDEDYSNWESDRQSKNLGVVPFPEGTRIWAWDRAAISAGTAHPEAAWRWLKALGEGVPQTYRGRFLPARQSVVEASGFLGTLDGELAAALRYAVEHGYGSGWSPTHAGYREWPGYSAFTGAIESVLRGETSVEEALAEAQTRAEAILSAQAARQAAATPVPTVVVSPMDSEEGASSEAVTIVFAATTFDAISPNPLQPFRDLARAFQATHPEIVVEVRQPTVRSGTTLRDIAQGADCFCWAPNLDEPDSLGAVLSLQPFLEADPSITAEDFYPSLLEPFVRRGQLWGLPGQAMPEVIMFNKDLFDAVGLSYPPVDWTLDDFLEIAIALTQGEGEEKKYGFIGTPIEIFDLLWVLESLDTQLVDESVDPPTIILNSREAAEALRWYKALVTEHGVRPTFISDLSDIIDETRWQAGYTQSNELIQNGRAAMWIILEDLELISDQRLNVGVATLPAGPTSEAGAYRSVSGYFISADTEAPEACWEWITYLTQQPDAVYAVPARRSVVQSEAFRQKVGEERAAVFEASVDGDERLGDLWALGDHEWLGPGALVWLGSAYVQVLKGEATAEEALEAAQETFDAYRACIIARDAFSDDEKIVACVKEADPTLPPEILER
jgi:multiple sugar transport system substrate-binding protein